MSTVERPLEGLGIAVDVVFVIAWLSLLRTTPAARRQRPQLALGLSIFELIGAPAFALTPFPSVLGVGSVVLPLLFLASAPVTWYALLAVGDERRSVVSARANTLMMALSGVRVLVWCARQLMMRSHAHELSMSTQLVFSVFNLLGVAGTIAVAAQQLWLIALLRERPCSADAEAAHVVPLASAEDDVLYGALWLGGGAFVTIGSFMMASNSSGGGRYLITTGAIVYGIRRLVRGLGRR